MSSWTEIIVIIIMLEILLIHHLYLFCDELPSFFYINIVCMLNSTRDLPVNFRET
jgi:hypothetical protein